MTEEHIKQTAELLKAFEPGFLPYPVFEQIARIVALPIVECIPLRLTSQGLEVLLLARSADDAVWPGLLHTPGTVIRATDLSADGSDRIAVERILHEELRDTPVGEPHYVGSILHQSKRGAEQAQLYWVGVQDEPHEGSFYRLDNLPPNLMKSQLTFIQEAARDFAANHGDSSLPTSNRLP